MKTEGSTNHQILGTGTKAPCKHFIDKNKFGTISQGSRANLIVLNANPYNGI